MSEWSDDAQSRANLEKVCRFCARDYNADSGLCKRCSKWYIKGIRPESKYAQHAIRRAVTRAVL